MDESESVRRELDERIGTALPTEDLGGRDRPTVALCLVDKVVDNRWQGRGMSEGGFRGKGERV